MRHTLEKGFPGGTSGKEPSCQCRRHKMWVGSLGQEDPLQEGMAIPSIILAWRIPWTEEHGGLQPIGSQRVGHNWSNLACMQSDHYVFFHTENDFIVTVMWCVWWFLFFCSCDLKQRPRFKRPTSYSIGEGNGNPLQCSCLENPRDGGA